MSELRYTTEFSADFNNRPLSYSSLKAFMKSPQHFIEHRLGVKKETEALTFGNVLDCMILTPDDYEKRFVMFPDDLKKPSITQINAKNPSEETIKQVARYNQFIEDTKGKIWVTKDDYELAKFLAEKTFKNEKAKELLDRVANTQKKISWTNKESGLNMVGYLDIEGDTFLCDLKSSKDGSPEGFMRDAYNYGYHIQSAVYLDAYKTLYGKFCDFFFIVVEKDAPYNISVFKATSDFIKLGQIEYERALTEIKFCEENNLWYQGYEFHSATGYHQLDLPGFAKNKLY